MPVKPKSILLGYRCFYVLMFLFIPILESFVVAGTPDLDLRPITKQGADSLINFMLCGSKTAENVSANEIKALLVSDNFADRECAAHILGKGVVIDTTEAIQLLINALKNEVDSAISYQNLEHSSLPQTELLKLGYLSSLEALADTGKAIIKKYLESSTGEFRTRLIILMARLGDPVARVEIRNILLNDTDPYLRFDAAGVILDSPSEGDIPALREALKDTFYAEDISHNRFYGVRINAANALMKLGFEMKRIGQHLENYEIVREPEK